jgi:hypothetical protein
MRRTAAIALVPLAAMTVAIAGCAGQRSPASAPGGAPEARPSQSFFVSSSVYAVPGNGGTSTGASAAPVNPEAAIPNPGTGPGDPRLTRALLPQSAAARYRMVLLPPAVVAMPDRDRGSLFIPLRQAADPVPGPPECAEWTAGLWSKVVTSFNVPGVQLAVDQQTVPAHADWPAYSEAIITGPAQVLDSLADPALPAACRSIAGQQGAYSGGVRPLAAGRLSLGSRAFEVTGTGKVQVWVAAEVVRGPGFVLEVRIPFQAFSPGSDPATWLGNVTAAACQLATARLG